MRLIDMGTAKVLSGKHGGRTFTIIGTPHYMAPEIISGKGYSYSVDLWSVGICLFEFLCGEVPFAEDADDPYEIYEEIVKKPIVYPSFMKDKKAKKIIDQLLSKVPELRLGGSYGALKGHVWFNNNNFDWVCLKKSYYFFFKICLIFWVNFTLKNNAYKHVLFMVHIYFLQLFDSSRV